MDSKENKLISEIATCFLEIRQAILAPEVQDLLHSQLTVFEIYLEGILEKGKKEEINKAFEIIEKYLSYEKDRNSVDYKVSNALAVSVLEHLDFEKYGKYAADFRKLYREWEFVNKAWREFEPDKDVKKFLENLDDL